MNNQSNQIPIYELSVNVLTTWQAHSLSNLGNNGTNRTMPRRQLLSDGTETDACSGSIAKRFHAALLTEQMMDKEIYLCPMCASGDGRRAGANKTVGLNMSSILACGMCDSHGFLITSKKGKKGGENENGSEDRERLSKNSLVEFSFALALPGQMAESNQLFTRRASRYEDGVDQENGQMIFKKSVRSGTYAQCVRYKAAGVGVDTEIWQTVITDEEERLRRHHAILMALRDQIQSPGGAMTATLLPHLTDIQGVVAIKTTVGRAPLCSPLSPDFVSMLENLQTDSCLIFVFNNLVEFHVLFQRLLSESYPVQPKIRQVTLPEVMS